MAENLWIECDPLIDILLIYRIWVKNGPWSRKYICLSKIQKLQEHLQHPISKLTKFNYFFSESVVGSRLWCLLSNFKISAIYIYDQRNGLNNKFRDHYRPSCFNFYLTFYIDEYFCWLITQTISCHLTLLSLQLNCTY